MEGKVGTQNPSPRGCTYSSLLRTAEVSTPHLALRPGRGSPGVTVRLGTSHRLGQCKELCAGHTAVRRILLLRPHVSARARPASRPAPPWSRPFPGRLCLTGDGESFPPPPNPQAKCKETGSHRGLLDLQLHWEGWKAQQHSCQKHGDRVRCCSVLRGPRLPGPSVSPQVLLCLQFLITPP